MQSAVSFENEGATIRGMIHVPEGAGPCPAVLVCHGFTGTKVEPHRIFVKTSRELEAAGVASLRVDFRGSGESDGDFEDMTCLSEVSDARAALTYLAGRDEVDAARIGILGLSMGGFVAASLLEGDDRPAACALWSAVCDFPSLIMKMATEGAGAPLPDGRIDFGGDLVGPGFVPALGALHPLEGVRGFGGPILIVHGDADEAVPVEHAYQYREAAESRDAETAFHIVAGGDHTYNSHAHEREVLGRTVEFLAGALSA